MKFRIFYVFQEMLEISKNFLEISYLREFTELPDIRKGSRACARDGKETEKGPGKWSVKSDRSPARTFILNGFSVGGRSRCRFVVGMASRALFLNGFLLLGVWFWRWMSVGCLARLLAALLWLWLWL